MKMRAFFGCVVFVLLGFAGSVGADEIHLKDGRVLEVQESWEEDGMIKYRKYGTVLGIAKDSVEKVIRFSDFERTLKDLENPSDEVRLKAVGTLGESQDERAVGPLIGLLTDGNTDIRTAAEKSLKKLGELASEKLIGTLESPESGVRTVAAKLLLNLDEDKIAQPLLQTLKNGDLEVTSVVYLFIIKKDMTKGVENTLLETLKKYGTSEMAKEFVNSGNAMLAEAGLNWR